VSNRQSRKLPLMLATVAIAMVVVVSTAIALWLVLTQQLAIEARADRIYTVSIPKTFEATRVVRGLEWIARDGEAILWVGTGEDRAERRQRLKAVTDDSALQGSAETRAQVGAALAVLDANLAALDREGAAGRPAALARWEPVADALKNLGVQMGAEAADSAMAESDAIIVAAQQANQSLVLAAAIIVGSVALAIALIYLVFGLPLRRLTFSLRLAGEGHVMSEAKERIDELQSLHEAAAELAHSHQQLGAMRAQLDRLAHTDELTGLANRRMFQERGAQMLELAKRYGDPCSLITFDLDHFKSINDRFGHEGGDVVLRTLGAYLRDFARTADLVARIGGEEFALVLPHTGLQVALVAAARLCDGIAGLRATMPDGQSVAFTASFGVAAYRDGDADLATLLSRADAALYRAKELGRNRVETAT
jgi:diguanylate cyclase (GGDEF)-like protein